VIGLSTEICKPLMSEWLSGGKGGGETDEARKMDDFEAHISDFRSMV